MSYRARKNPDGYLEWHPADFLSSPKVARMTLAEQGAYRRLLDHAFLEGGSISADPEDLADYLGIAPEDVPAAFTPLVRRCFVEQDGRLQNPRMAREMGLRDAYSRQQSLRAQIRHASTDESREAIRVELAEVEAHLRSDAPALHPQCARSAPAVHPQCTRSATAGAPHMHSHGSAVPRHIPTHPDTTQQTDPTGGTGGDGPPAPADADAPPAGKRKRKKACKVAAWRAHLATGADFAWLMDTPKAEPLKVWIDHLDARLPRAHTPTGAQQALKRIAEMDDAQFEAAVRHSIEGNYQGLYEPKDHQRSNGTRSVWDMVRSGEISVRGDQV